LEYVGSISNLILIMKAKPVHFFTLEVLMVELLQKESVSGGPI
jgi:hypothetical protein